MKIHNVVTCYRLQMGVAITNLFFVATKHLELHFTRKKGVTFVAFNNNRRRRRFMIYSTTVSSVL